jgi:pimeloyl-ACP methyl ester carboxylesterase
MSVPRRAVLLGGIGLAAACVGAGYELVQNGALPGKYTLARLDGACGSEPPAITGPLPRRQVESFFSEYRHREVQMVTLIPAGAAGTRELGVVVALHGAGGGAVSMANLVGPAMTRAKVARFVTICVDGGDTYWHKHADGDDPVGMIVHEVLPRALAAGLSVGRIGITGLSMGGYGALLLAERFAAGSGTAPSVAAGSGTAPSVAAVAALSPAIFPSYASARASNGASFDSPADFNRNNVLADLEALRHVPAWIACGADDPFQPQTSQVLTRLAALTGRPVPGGILSGCHDDAFWNRNMPAALQFIGAQLT